MRIVIAGGHGQIALLLSHELARRGDLAVGLIRKPEQADDLRAAGAEPVVLDLEASSVDQVADVLREQSADAVLFAAGAGPGSSAERKYTVDRDGSVKLAAAAEAAGVRRFLQISTMGAGSPPRPGTDDVWAAYIDAKTQAEDDLRGRGLDWTVLRPGRLLDTPSTGLVALAVPPLPSGGVPRADVALVLAELADTGAGAGRVLELTSGETPVAAAVSALS
ncbi:NAD-dependent dehydratase [Streptacidiphilus pinicola]|uniref:NAD-dependent dehydratase n=1 Tax=Streptacidiphilus pinicola TaxID=2219663 RepID=A0A2X0JU52_9ACTN|nr:SDR family oxidoreductase [Streptacidiphilus pinicola]RAG80395.1 NAD-dependent dehydratase [Streptacidiphilus pinicola]